MRRIAAPLLIVFLLAAALGGRPLRAQGRCTVDDTIATCFGRYLDAEAPKATAIASAEGTQDQELMSEPMAPDTGGANLMTNKKNLLPLLAMSGLLGNGDTTADGTLVLDLNFLIPGLARPGAKNAQLEAVINTEPKISDALREALPADDRDELSGQLGEKVGGLDDYAIRFTYDHANRSHGRNLEQYARRFDALASAAIDSFGEGAPKTPDINVLLAFIAAHPDDLPDDASEAKFRTLPEDRQTIALALTEAKAREFADFQAGATRALHAAGLASFYKLIDNQPQFHLTAERKLRGPLTGADETSLKVTYEWSATNFNAAMSDDCHRSLDQDRPAAEKEKGCLDQYISYVRSNGASIDRGNRFSFSGEYADARATTLNPGLADIDPVHLKAVHKAIVSAGWSRDFVFGDGEPVSMDLVAEYQDVSDDPMRQDRGVATLTLTRKIGGVAVPFGIVYANHGEFLGDVDQRLSAHLGLRFDASGKKPAK